MPVKINKTFVLPKSGQLALSVRLKGYHDCNDKFHNTIAFVTLMSFICDISLQRGSWENYSRHFQSERAC